MKVKVFVCVVVVIMTILVFGLFCIFYQVEHNDQKNNGEWIKVQYPTSWHYEFKKPLKKP